MPAARWTASQRIRCTPVVKPCAPGHTRPSDGGGKFPCDVHNSTRGWCLECAATRGTRSDEDPECREHEELHLLVRTQLEHSGSHLWEDQQPDQRQRSVDRDELEEQEPQQDVADGSSRGSAQLARCSLHHSRPTDPEPRSSMARPDCRGHAGTRARHRSDGGPAGEPRKAGRQSGGARGRYRAGTPRCATAGEPQARRCVVQSLPAARLGALP
jgi:hypothetical protein